MSSADFRSELLVLDFSKQLPQLTFYKTASDKFHAVFHCTEWLSFIHTQLSYMVECPSSRSVLSVPITDQSTVLYSLVIIICPNYLSLFLILVFSLQKIQHRSEEKCVFACNKHLHSRSWLGWLCVLASNSWRWNCIHVDLWFIGCWDEVSPKSPMLGLINSFLLICRAPALYEQYVCAISYAHFLMLNGTIFN